MNQNGIEPLYIKNLLCSYQIDHKRPILPSCMGTTVEYGTDWILRNQFINDALSEQTIDWKSRLPQMGIGSIILHPELFQESERAELLSYLEKIFGPADAQHFIGEHLLLWNLDTVSNADSTQKYLEYTADYRKSIHYEN